MRVEGRGAGLGLQDGREEGLKRPYFYISNMLVFMYLFVFTRKRKAVLYLRLCQGDICGKRSSKSAIGFVTFFVQGFTCVQGKWGGENPQQRGRHVHYQGGRLPSPQSGALQYPWVNFKPYSFSVFFPKNSIENCRIGHHILPCFTGVNICFKAKRI